MYRAIYFIAMCTRSRCVLVEIARRVQFHMYTSTATIPGRRQRVRFPTGHRRSLSLSDLSARPLPSRTPYESSRRLRCACLPCTASARRSSEPGPVGLAATHGGRREEHVLSARRRRVTNSRWKGTGGLPVLCAPLLLQFFLCSKKKSSVQFVLHRHVRTQPHGRYGQPGRRTCCRGRQLRELLTDQRH